VLREVWQHKFLALEIPVFWDMMPYRWVEYVRTNVLGQFVLCFFLRAMPCAKIKSWKRRSMCTSLYDVICEKVGNLHNSLSENQNCWVSAPFPSCNILNRTQLDILDIEVLLRWFISCCCRVLSESFDNAWQPDASWYVSWYLHQVQWTVRTATERDGFFEKPEPKALCRSWGRQD
jgi:hypothetical protein